MATAAERRAILEKEAAAHQRQRRRYRAATGDRDRWYRHRSQPAPKPAAPGAPSWWCVIAAAEHFEWDGQPPYEVRREMADSAGHDPWAGAA
jgi:hypothetical protein